jgi:hypothetical protein
MLFNKHPRKGCVYAITAGKFLGELFVYMEKKESVFKFLSLPTMVSRDVPTDKFDLGLKGKIIDIVEKLPKDVYSTCIKQYRKNSTINK